MARAFYDALMRLDLQESYEETWEAWRLECNAKGLEIFYDMSDAVERGIGCDYTCDDDCEESHTIKVGHYNTRPCAEHTEGHVCNPPRYGKITNLSVSGISLEV